MLDKEIYNYWLFKNDDLRYLRPRRWEEIKKVILKYEVKSVLEFGSGISTLLFDNLCLKVLSYETDLKFIYYMKSRCSQNVSFRHWDNNAASPVGDFDFALVDGALPRNRQFYIALNRSPIVAIDDFELEWKETILPALTKHERIDSQTTSLAIFRRNN